MIGTESGSIFQSFDEQYSLGDDSAVARPNYTSGMLQAERLWKWVTLNDYFAGNFMWTGVDYLGESTWPFKGFGSGVLDIIGHPKDSYYLYQSLWTDRPVLAYYVALMAGLLPFCGNTALSSSIRACSRRFRCSS